MSKGHTRRPSVVDRKAFDSSWEQTFGANGGLESLLDAVDSTSLDGLTGGRAEAAEPLFGMDPCDVADTMTQGFKDQRSRA